MQPIAALFIDPKGPYPTLNLDCWDKKRDARKYFGPGPVIAHPPCGRWSGFARLNESRWGAKVGDDGGCFKHALQIVREFGGVIEHPAKSLAWDHFGLQKPLPGSWQRAGANDWVTQVSQVAYGHKARKRTWLYVRSVMKPPDANWSEPTATHWCGNDRRCRNPKPTLLPSEACRTPLLFAEYLLSIARSIVL